MKKKNIHNLKQLLMQQLMLHRIMGLISEAQYQALIASVPSFLEACDQLKIDIKAVDDELIKYREIITGVAIEKRNERESLAEFAFPILESARAYAIKNNNFTLAENFNLSIADMVKMGFQKLLDRMGSTQSLIQPLIPLLVNYNITQQVFDTWKSKTASLAAFLNNGPKSAIEKRSMIGAEVEKLMKIAMNQFNTQVVPLSSNFTSTPAFYITFLNYSIIGSPSIRHSRLLAHCQDELGAPVYGITVTVDSFTDPDTGKMYKSVSAVSDPNGDAEVVEFFAGNRTVTLSGDNIETTTFPAISFERGKAVSHTFTIRPSFTNIPAPAENKVKAEK